MPVATLVALVNGWGTAARREAHEQALPFPSAAAVVAGTALRVPDQALTERRLRRLADDLYPVFADGDLTRRADTVTALLGRLRMRPVLVVDNDVVREAFEVPDVDALAAAAVLTLRQVLVSAGAERLGTCTGNRCGDVYVDASPGGHRRYCSLTCQNRTRVAEFRRRKAAEKLIADRPTEA